MTDRLITDEFRTPRGWDSGHLQTIRNRVVPRTYDLEAVSKQRSTLIDLADGTGDELVVQLHTSRQRRVGDARGGLVVLIHGLGGTAESVYVRASAHGLLSAGFNVARVDLRGVGLSGRTSALFYHAGRTDDLRAVLGALATEPEASDNPTGEPRLAIMGFSLGGNMTIKLMGEPHDQVPVFGAVAISAPLDLTVGAVHLRRIGFGVYEKVLLAGLKRQAMEPGPRGSVRVSPQERTAIHHARTLAEFDDAFTAPRNGWKDSAEYYAVNSSNQFLPKIAAPTLVIHSVDDPMVPAEPYRDVDWTAVERGGFVQRRITARGGHVGFHERGELLPWYVGQAADFLSVAD